MKRLHGNIGGLKSSQTRRLEMLYRRRVPPDQVITFELAREISSLSYEGRRQVGLLIDRNGRIVSVIVGDHQKIVIPNLEEYRTAPGRLRGLRCVHTHLKSETLTQDDLTDLALLRLDLIAAITIKPDGFPDQVWTAHLLPRDAGRWMSTPELSFAIRHLNAVSGYMFSASHNLPTDNGKKVYDQFGGQPVTEAISPEDLEKIREFAIDHAADTDQPMTCG